jgi:hypothetical protein
MTAKINWLAAYNNVFQPPRLEMLLKTLKLKYSFPINTIRKVPKMAPESATLFMDSFTRYLNTKD